MPAPLSPATVALIKATVPALEAHGLTITRRMYERLFQTQRDWSESPDAATVFRGYAQDLGLDLNAYDAAVADPATAAKIQADKDAGLAAGVEGTPTIFVNGEKVQLRSVQDITDALDAAVNR